MIPATSAQPSQEAAAEIPRERMRAESPQLPVRAPTRLALVDALRGWAALMVFGFHITPFLSGPWRSVLGNGWLGVQVFFAISGFVIAHSVGRSRITPGYMGNFILRRSIRLDPPYWCTIAAACLLLTLSNLFLAGSDPALPSLASVGAHVLYLQNVLGYGDVVDVFWSLCIEVQFYLAFVVVLGIVQSLSTDGRSFSGRAGPVAVVLFAGLSGLCAVSESVLQLPPKVWFLPFWNEFFAGSLVAWVLQGRMNRVWFIAFTLILGLHSTLVHWNLSALTALATAAFLLVAGQLGWLPTGMNWGGLPMFGRMSYSFYLIHTLVLSRLTRLVARLGGSSDTAGLVVIPLGLLCSVAAAAALYYLVESPCMRLSKRFRPAGGGA